MKAKKSLIYKSIYLLNKLPYKIRTYNPKKLSKYLQSNIGEYFPIDRITNFEND